MRLALYSKFPEQPGDWLSAQAVSFIQNRLNDFPLEGDLAQRVDDSFSDSIQLACGALIYEMYRDGTAKSTKAQQSREIFESLNSIDNALNEDKPDTKDIYDPVYWLYEVERVSQRLMLDEYDINLYLTEYTIYDQMYAAYSNAHNWSQLSEENISILTSLSEIRLIYAKLLRILREESESQSEEKGALVFMEATTKGAEHARKIQAYSLVHRGEYEDALVSFTHARELLRMAENFYNSHEYLRSPAFERQYIRSLNQRALLLAYFFALFTSPELMKKIPGEILEGYKDRFDTHDWEGSAMQAWNTAIDRILFQEAQIKIDLTGELVEVRSLKRELLSNRSSFAEYAGDIDLIATRISQVPAVARLDALQRIISLYSTAIKDQRALRLSRSRKSDARTQLKESKIHSLRERILQYKEQIVFLLSSPRETFPSIVARLKVEFDDASQAIAETKDAKLRVLRINRLNDIWTSITTDN